MGINGFGWRLAKRVAHLYSDYRHQKLEEGVPEDELKSVAEFCRNELRFLMRQGHYGEDDIDELVEIIMKELDEWEGKS